MKNKLIVRKGKEVQKIFFDAPQKLDYVLAQGGISMTRPCSGIGSCGKCRVKLYGTVSDFSEREKYFGERLACQAVLLGDAEVYLPEQPQMKQIEIDSIRATENIEPMPGKIGAAVDIGTTTLAVRVYDLADGRKIGEQGLENPQSSLAADVMGRMSVALNDGADSLRTKITDAINTMLENILLSAGKSTERVDSLVITGNTTMLYLLVGHSVTCLSRSPFRADRLFDEECGLFGGIAYLPPCISAFVGADISCAVLASGMCRDDNVKLLCDVGTNAEIALWKDQKLYVTSAAAGPAFEGVGISCGCGSIQGAIDRLWVEDEKICFHTINEAEPIGLCGSGLLDALAVLIELGIIDESGGMKEEAVVLSANVRLSRADIRAAQLAKAAVAAGIEMLMKVSGTEFRQISNLYIAGGFGGHIDISNAVKIGFIPSELSTKIQFLGNGALAGAEKLLLDKESRIEIRRIVNCALSINLGGSPDFAESLVDHLSFCIT